MRIIIQCAGYKNSANTFSTTDGKRVDFVGNPPKDHSSKTNIYRKPDAMSDNNSDSWRKRVHDYNEAGGNPLNFFPAYKLYRNKAYKGLVKKFDIDNVYILSACWGLIRADYLIPTYDLTFAWQPKRPYVKKIPKDYYPYKNMLPDNGKKIIYLGGIAYQKTFCTLTKSYRGEKVMFYHSKDYPKILSKFSGFTAKKHEMGHNRNWQYRCAQEIIDNEISV